MIRVLFIVGLIFSSCGLMVDKSVSFELIDLRSYADYNVQINNSKQTNDSDIIFANISIGYWAVHTESFYALIFKNDSSRVLKINSGVGIYAHRIEDNDLVLTELSWNTKDKWVEIEIENSITRYNWDSIPIGFENFRQEGIYKFSDNKMLKQEDLKESGLYFISAYSVGEVKKFSIDELKNEYWP